MSKQPLYKNIEHAIKEKILNGEYKPGSRLLSETEMTDLYKVSRITIRNAMNNLESENFVERIRGKGTYVRNGEDYSQSIEPNEQSSSEKKISLIVPHLNSNHTMRIFDGLYAEAEKNGYFLTVYQTKQDQKKEEHSIRKSLQDNVDGIIIYPVQKELYNEEILKLALNRFPTVLVDRSLEGISINSVVSDNEKASYQATKFLIEQGHSNIGFLSPSLEMAIPLQDRYKGFIRAHEESNITINKDYIYINSINMDSEFDESISESSIAGFDQFLTKNSSMTALLCAEPLELKLLFYWTNKLGISIPDDLSFLCFDDFEFADFFSIPPTVVRQDSEKIGRTAFSLLKKLMSGETTNFSAEQLETKLVIRKSVRKIN
jgi:GntR family transcriptional regulator, arabinose operon transcriptional repressor